jgi:PI-3-kinase-related kinase SMG-1
MQSGKLVEQAQKIVTELQRLTILWEELWYIELGHLQSVAIRRLSLCQLEVARIQKAGGLYQECLTRYMIVMNPIIEEIDKIALRTIHATATTPHDKWFQKYYGPKLREAIEGLKNPPELSNLKRLWAKLFGSVSVVVALVDDPNANYYLCPAAVRIQSRGPSHTHSEPL